MASLARASSGERAALLREKHELRYLGAEIERHRPTGEHARHVTNLKSSLDFYLRERDSFGAARTRCAHAALGLAVVLTRDLSHDPRAGPGMPPALIEFLAAADEATASVRQALLVDPGTEPLAPYLVDEAFLVYFTAAIYDIRVARTDSFSPEAVAAACAIVRDRSRAVRYPQPPMLRLAYDCALWTIGDGPDRRSAAERVRRALEAGRRPPSASDRWLMERVARRAAADAR